MTAPQFVKSHVQSNKVMLQDTEAISETVQRPSMHFVSAKSIEQQAVLSLHIKKSKGV